jgi:predicted O-methyltransferase YrrM
MVLNTGWSKWDIHLSKFVGKKLNILEIGSYKGDATSWFLNNLSSNKNSMVYAVDTWEGSPEYFHGNFQEVEDIFDRTIKLTGKSKQLIKMKMYSSKALIELNRNNIVFDIIFIDASHEAIDVLSDAVLSWNILNENGVLIFDDYKWDQLENYHFRPKVAIDAFLDIYKTQLKTLYIGRQVIIEKKMKDEFNKPVPGKYYELMNRLNIYNITNLQCLLDDKPKKLSFKLKFDSKIPFYKKTLGFNKELFELSMNKNKSKTKTAEQNSIYDLHAFVRYMSNKNKVFNLINLDNSLKNKSLITNLISYLDNNLNNAVIENICYVSNNKLLKIKSNEMTFLNISQTPEHKNKLIKFFLESKFNLKKLNYYDLNLASFKSNNNNSNVIFSELKNIKDIKIVCDKISKKIDFFIGSLYLNVFDKKIETKFQEQYFYIDFLNLIYFILNCQNKGGIAIIGTFLLMTEVSIQLLWILKKFYKKITLTLYDTTVINTFSNKIICEGFKGCSKKDIDEIYKIYENINNKNTIFIENIIDISNNELKIYNEFKNKIAKYNIERYNLLKNNQKIINDLIYFNNKEDLSKSKRENMTNKIFTVQLRYLIGWINKYSVFDNININPLIE